MRAANSLLFTVHSFTSRSYIFLTALFDCAACAGSQKSVGPRKDHVWVWWSLFVVGALKTSCFGGPSSWVAQEVGAALLDSMGRFRDNYFGRGGGHRDFWRGGSFSEIGGCLERKLRLLHFYIFMLSLEALLLRNALAGLRDMNFDAQISLQAQHSVDF